MQECGRAAVLYGRVMMKVIGIDIGTTTISAAVLDQNTRQTIDTRTVPHDSVVLTEDGWASLQDPEKIVRTAKRVLDELLEMYSDISAVGLTGQMHGIVYVNEEGASVGPLHTWQDGRGEVPDEDGETTVGRIARLSGRSAATGYGMVTHIYNVSHGLVPKDAVSFSTIMDYFAMCLTGRRSPLIHAGNAASFGLFDLSSFDFDRMALGTLGVDLSMIPTVTKDIEVVGAYRDIPVTVSIGDNQASFLGAAGMDMKTALINMGTGGQISVLSDIPFEAPGIEPRPFMRNTYLLAGSALCSGKAYAILERFFRLYHVACGGANEPQYEVMNALAEKGMMVQDHMQVDTVFCGTRVDPTVRAGISRISEANFTPESLIVGVLEGMSRELHEMYAAVLEGTGQSISRLVGSGNAIRKNSVLQQIIRDMFQADLVMSERKEEAASGAAISTLYRRA